MPKNLVDVGYWRCEVREIVQALNQIFKMVVLPMRVVRRLAGFEMIYVSEVSVTVSECQTVFADVGMRCPFADKVGIVCIWVQVCKFQEYIRSL